MRVTTAGVAEENGLFFVALRRPGTSIGESWEFPGGKKKDDETPQQALGRELWEEFGVHIDIEELLCTGTFYNRSVQYFLYAYKIHFRDEPHLRSGEHQDFRWVEPAHLPHMQFPVSDHIIIEKIIELYDNTK
jgi:mutator protein MutT